MDERKLKEEYDVMRGIIKYLLLKKGFSLIEPKQYQEFLDEIEKHFSLRRETLEQVMRSVLDEMLADMVTPS